MKVDNIQFFPTKFIPNLNYSGVGIPLCIGGENMILRTTTEKESYFEGYKGSKSLSEPIATKILTGTLSWTNTSKLVVGTSTLFLSELRIGQFILANAGSSRVLLVVEDVVDDLNFITTSKPSTSGSTSSNEAYVLPVIFAVGNKRGTAIRGKVLQYLKGNYIGAGDGTFRLNGQPLNSTLALSKIPRFALFNPTTGLYTQDDVGIIKPTGASPFITVTAVTPSTPTQMRAGTYNIRVCLKNTETYGFSDPSPALVATEVVTLTDGQAIHIVFNYAMPVDANAYDIYSTKYKDNSTAGAEVRYMGPWYLIRTVKDSDIGGRAAATSYDLYFSDAEIDSSFRILTFDNDPPIDTEFIDLVDGIPIYFSCGGKGNASKPLGTSPGPSAVPGKPGNPEAAMFSKAFTTAGCDYIIGEFSSKSRMYVLCQNSLQTLFLTSLDTLPVAFRSLWNCGFRNPFNAVFIDDYLYAWSTRGLLRNLAGADGSSVDTRFATDILNITRDIDCGKILVEYSQKNRALCCFQSAAEKRNGFWVTKVHMFLIDEGVWSLPIVLSKPDRDFIVSGVASIGEDLYFLAGGADGSGVVTVDTYQFDEPTSESIGYSIVWSFTNKGTDEYTKRAKGVNIVGKFTNGATVKFYGAGPDSAFDLTSLNSGTNDKGSVAIPAIPELAVHSYNFTNVDPFTHITCRLEGAYIGTNLDRFDKMTGKVEINSSES